MVDGGLESINRHNMVGCQDFSNRAVLIRGPSISYSIMTTPQLVVIYVMILTQRFLLEIEHSILLFFDLYSGHPAASCFLP